MLAKVLSAAVLGIEAFAVEVEVDLSSGLPAFTTVGLPDAAVKESRDRVAAAVKNTGFQFPLKKITVNLAPADVRKEGSAFDLPIAVGILRASGIISGDRLDGHLLLGELSLDGRVKPIKGALPIAAGMRGRKGLSGLILPRKNAPEAAAVSKEVSILAADTLPQVVEHLNGEQELDRVAVDTKAEFGRPRRHEVDLSEIRGQQHAKRAMEVACAGGHNILMIGPPGSGKSMLAQRIPTILPELTLEEAIETSKVHSVLGLTGDGASLVSTRPYRPPHHTISDAGLIGGGSFPMPGEVSMAHNGVLFLDELPVVQAERPGGPAPAAGRGNGDHLPGDGVGFLPGPVHAGGRDEPLPLRVLRRHGAALHVHAAEDQELPVQGVGAASGPHRHPHRGPPGSVPGAFGGGRRGDELGRSRPGQPGAGGSAGAVQGKKIFCNAHMGPRHIAWYCGLGEEEKKLLETAMERLALSARAYHRIIKVARTIADLAGEEDISTPHLAEAIQYRSLDREVWA